MSVESAPPRVAPEAPVARGSGGRLASLDGLRGIAILLVLIAHYVVPSVWLQGPVGSASSYVRALLGLAGSGVDLFFVLSGFLIGGILLQHRESPCLLRTFYIRRFFRIVPLAWGSIVVSMLVHYASRGNAAPGVPWWAGFTFTTNLFLAAQGGWVLSWLTAHWSLGIEEQFYLALPWVVRSCAVERLRWIGPALVLLGLLARIAIVLVSPQHEFACAMLPFCRADSLGVGVTIAWVVRQHGIERLQQHRRRFWILLGIGAVGMVLLARAFYRTPLLFAAVGYTGIAVFYGCLLVLVLAPRERWLRFIITSAPLRLYGRCSFFIYLFQLLLADSLVSLAFRQRLGPMPMLTPLHSLAAITLMLIPAAASWRFLESPLLQQGHRWRYD